MRRVRPVSPAGFNKNENVVGDGVKENKSTLPVQSTFVELKELHNRGPKDISTRDFTPLDEPLEDVLSLLDRAGSDIHLSDHGVMVRKSQSGRKKMKIVLFTLIKRFVFSLRWIPRLGTRAFAYNCAAEIIVDWEIETFCA